MLVLETHDHVEPSLAGSHFRLLFAGHSDTNCPDNITGREPYTCDCLPVNADLHSRHAGKLFCSKVLDSTNVLHQFLSSPALFDQFVQVRTKDTHGYVRALRQKERLVFMLTISSERHSPSSR